MDQKCEEYFSHINSFPANVAPFLACGDLTAYDADRSYPLNYPLFESSYQYKEATQSPINPPYMKAVLLKKASALAKPTI